LIAAASMEYAPPSLCDDVRAAVRKLMVVSSPGTTGSVNITHQRARGGKSIPVHRRDWMPLVLTARGSDGTVLGTERVTLHKPASIAEGAASEPALAGALPECAIRAAGGAPTGDGRLNLIGLQACIEQERDNFVDLEMRRAEAAQYGDGVWHVDFDDDDTSSVVYVNKDTSERLVTCPFFTEGAVKNTGTASTAFWNADSISAALSGAAVFTARVGADASCNMETCESEADSSDVPGVEERSDDSGDEQVLTYDEFRRHLLNKSPPVAAASPSGGQAVAFALYS